MPTHLPVFTFIHVLLSLVGIIAGLVAVGGLISGVLFNRWIGVFFTTTVLTNVTGFGFPFVTLLPSHILAALSLVVLPIAMAALYLKHLAGPWRAVFVGFSVFALYLNFFVLVAQLLQKTPVLAALAPSPQAPAFGIAQLIVLLSFLALGRASLRGFRDGGKR